MQDERGLGSRPDRFIGNKFGEPRVTDFGPFAALPDELAAIVKKLDGVEFPIDSKNQMLEKLGGEDRLDVAGELPVRQLVMFIPAYYFPLTSVENAAEKLSEIYFQRRTMPRLTSPCRSEDLRRRMDKVLDEQPELLEHAARLVIAFRRLYHD